MMSTDSLFGDSWLRVQRRRARLTRSEAAVEYRSRWGWATELIGPAVQLLTGQAFDVLDVPEPAGCQALVRLERMGIRPGPNPTNMPGPAIRATGEFSVETEPAA